MGSSSLNFTNCDLPDVLDDRYDNPPVKKYKYQAVCVSGVCNVVMSCDIVRTKSIKNVKRFDTDCPDCGHVLVWERNEVKEK